MVSNYIQSDSRMKDAWKLFIQKGILKREIIPDRVVYSWVRCRLKNLEPDDVGIKITLRQDVEMVQRSKLAIILSVQKIMKERFVEVPYYCVTLQHLVLFSSDSFDDWIFEGIEFSEEHHGTNALGFAIESNAFEVTVGHEHYKSKLHAYASAAFPLNQEHMYVTMIFPLNQFEALSETFEDLNVAFQNMKLEQQVHIAPFLKPIEENLALETAVGVLESGTQFNPFLCVYQYDGDLISALQKDVEHGYYQLESSKPFIAQTQEAFRSGRKSFLYPFEDDTLFVQCLELEDRRYVGVFRADSLLEATNQWSGNRALYTLEDIKGKSDAIRMTLFNASKAASHDAPFLIIGERGTGKSILAQGIHVASKRKSGPFVSIDCASTPLRALESLLFGNLRENSRGALALAKGGTLYIDHIEALPNPLQKRLLKWVDQDNLVISESVRFIFSTTNDLKGYVAQGIVREDLHHRIGLFTVLIPPLRDRKTDIADLAPWLLKELTTLYGIQEPMLEEGFIDALCELQWVGNARELQETILDLLLKYKNVPILKASHLEQKLHLKQILDTGVSLNLEHMEKEAIKAAIEESKSNLSKASELLGIGRTTLYRKIEKYDLRV